MKKFILLFLIILGALATKAQVPQKLTTWYEYRMVLTDSLGIKNDTFPVPAAYASLFTFLASKNDVLYSWSMIYHKWIGAGGGTALTFLKDSLMSYGYYAYAPMHFADGGTSHMDSLYIDTVTASQAGVLDPTNFNHFVTAYGWGNHASVGYLNGTTGVPSSRTLTINGVTYDLTANRSWTISTSGGGLPDAYSSFTDGSNTASATGATPFKIRSGNSAISVLVTNNDITHGDNVLFTFNQANITIGESQVTGLPADLNLKANLTSPTFLGTPAAPTAANGDASTQLANTLFVHNALVFPASQLLIGTGSGIASFNTVTSDGNNLNAVTYNVNGHPYISDVVSTSTSITPQGGLLKIAQSGVNNSLNIYASGGADYLQLYEDASHNPSIQGWINIGALVASQLYLSPQGGGVRINSLHGSFSGAQQLTVYGIGHFNPYLNGSVSNGDMMQVYGDVNESGSSGYTGLAIRIHETALGSGAKNLIEAGQSLTDDGQGAFTRRFSVDNTGGLFSNALNDGTGVARMVTVNNGIFSYQTIPSGSSGSIASGTQYALLKYTAAGSGTNAGPSNLFDNGTNIGLNQGTPLSTSSVTVKGLGTDNTTYSMYFTRSDNTFTGSLDDAGNWQYAGKLMGKLYSSSNLAASFSFPNGNYIFFAGDLTGPGGNRTITLPSASAYIGQVCTIVNYNTNAAFHYSFTASFIDRTGTSTTTCTNGAVYQLFSDGSNWKQIN
jgi:hypothetical protein